MLALEGRLWSVSITCFVLAALVKSPVPFVLLVFLAVWMLLTGSWRKRPGTLVLLYGSSLAAALTAETLRVLVAPTVDGRKVRVSAPEWYFGALSDRWSVETWSTAVKRTMFAFPTTSLISGLLFIGLVLVVVLVALRASWKITVACTVGFLSGWLVFTEVYWHHDYYGMPAVLMVFLAISVSVSSAVEGLPSVRPWMNWLVVATILISIVYGPQNGNPQVTSFGDVARFAMADRSEFLYASDETEVGPQTGGLSATKMVIIRREQLEQECDSLLRRYQAVIVRGTSACLQGHRAEAATYVTHVDSTAGSSTPFTLWERD
jgi:hypothetical protein